MQNCCLPIELCELIMDLVVEPFPRWKRFHWSTDCRPGNVVHCARVCSAWLPRARCVLYSSVLFKNPSQVQHFINSITESPLLADMVRELVIKPEDDNTYIPFVHERLLGRLRYLRTLVYDFARGRAWVYPPHHHLLIARFPLTELAIRYPCRDANPAMWFETFRLICSLHHLHTLHLYIGTSPGLSDADIVRLDTIRRLPACAKIETLVIEGANFYEFLPKGAFGTSVRQLTLRFYSGPILTSGPWLSQIASFSSLQELHIRVDSSGEPGEDDCAVYRYIAPILTHISDREIPLHTITFHMGPIQGQKREEFLLQLSSRNVDKLLVKFTKLETLRFWLSERPCSGYDTMRWRNLLDDYLPKLPQGSVSISIEVDSDIRRSDGLIATDESRCFKRLGKRNPRYHLVVPANLSGLLPYMTL